MTDSEYKQKYYELWKQIDNIDKRHAQFNSQWNPKEIQSVVDGVYELISNTPKTKYNTVDLDRLSDCYHFILREDYNVDFLTVNMFKDFVHKVWEHGFPTEKTMKHLEECEEMSPTDDAKTWREVVYDNIQNLKMFNRVEFRKLLVKPHTKEGYDKTFLARDSFFNRFIELSNKELGDCFGSFIHDILQNQSHARLIVEHIPKMNVALAFNVIGQQQYLAIMQKISEVARKELSSGEWTWDLDQQSKKLRTEIYLVEDMVKAAQNSHEIKQVGLTCDEMNCHTNLPLTEQERKDLEMGLGISPRYCNEHIEYDDSGDRRDNIELSPYDPDCFSANYPATVRIKRADPEKGNSIYQRICDYLKEHKIQIIKECVEKYKYSGNFIYVKIESKTKLVAMVEHFKDDFHYTFGGMELVKDTQ